MIEALQIFSRWKAGIALAAGLALLGALMAASFYRHAYHDEQAARAADRASYRMAQAEAEHLAQAALHTQEAEYRAKAKEADHAFTEDLADARSAADRYIAAHRVRGQAVGGSTGSAPAAAGDSSAGLREGVPADSLVAISDADVQACSDVSAYALRLRDWALSVGE